MNTMRCGQCTDAFTDRDHLELHLGRIHQPGPGFDDAVAREEEWLERIRRRVRGLLHAFPLIASYFLFLVAAAQFDLFYWALLPAPGIAGFAALVYYMGYTRDPGPPGPRA